MAISGKQTGNKNDKQTDERVYHAKHLRFAVFSQFDTLLTTLSRVFTHFIVLLIV